MNLKLKTPSWITDGPHDAEYRTYKLRGAVSGIKEKLGSGNLMDALFEIDSTLDYLYKYDAVQMTQDPNPVSQIISGFDIPDLELVFTTEEELENDDVLDLLLDEALDSYEDLHSICRKQWRIIEDGLTCGYIPKKPYFLNDGFVFIKTPDNKMHIYHFVKPNKYFTYDWKQFKLSHMCTKEWTKESYISSVEEIVSKESDKIIIKMDCTTETILENNALCVINQKIFSMLHRDYSF